MPGHILKKLQGIGVYIVLVILRSSVILSSFSGDLVSILNGTRVVPSLHEEWSDYKVHY